QGEDWAVTALRKAGASAFSRGAVDVARRYLERAVVELGGDEPPAELSAELGLTELAANNPDAETHLRVALEQTKDPDSRASLSLALGRAVMMRGDLPGAMDVFQRAISERGDQTDDQALRLEAELIGAARLAPSTRALLSERFQRTRTSLDTDTPGERLVLANLSLEMVTAGEPVDDCVAAAQRALAGGKLLHEEGPHAPVFYFPAWSLALCDRYAPARAALAEALQEARKRGSALGFAIANCFSANVSFRMGELAEAEASARAALSLESADGWPLGLPFTVSFLVDALTERRDLDSAEAVLAVHGFMGELPDFTLFIPLLHARGALRVAQGRPEEGLADLLLSGKRAKAWGSRNPTFLPWRPNAAMALLGLGRREEALELTSETLGLARSFGAPRAIGIALRAHGLVTGHDEGLEHLAEATEILAHSEARVEYARASVDHGAALRRAGSRRAAREALSIGMDLASRCSATALVEQARTELAAAGARPRNVLRSGLEALTPSERRVAELAADGLSNKEIAQALFVTRKTVEKHLGNVYGKLDISSREQLPDSLAEGAAASA
ncbi:MAG: helix-turn-helix transcriptional regulator, partial [Actinomycetota bacterium]|nr:helix-turn-helix transcriptional regulator [Actinomycetota bacterium]